MTTRTARSLLQACALCVCSLTLVASMQGCMGTMSGWSDASYNASLNTTVPYAAPMAIEATTQNGSIIFVKGGTQVTVAAVVRAQTQARADAVKLTTVTQPDGTLQILTTWPGERLSNEGASLTITLPDASSISATTSNARIEVPSGLNATKAKLRTSNGSISVTDLAGSVDANTSNARVELTNVGVCNVDTSNGAVVVSLQDDVKGPVMIETSNARVDLTIGSAFGGKVSLNTSNARISVEAPRATSVSLDGDDGIVTFGEGAASTIDTSNGSITLKEKKK